MIPTYTITFYSTLYNTYAGHVPIVDPKHDTHIFIFYFI